MNTGAKPSKIASGYKSFGYYIDIHVILEYPTNTVLNTPYSEAETPPTPSELVFVCLKVFWSGSA